MSQCHWQLTWFNAHNDDHVGSVVLPAYLGEEEVRRMFWLPDGEEPEDGCHIVRASQRAELQSMVDGQHQIDLNLYDYFVEAVEGLP